MLLMSFIVLNNHNIILFVRTKYFGCTKLYVVVALTAFIVVRKVHEIPWNRVE